MSSSVFDTRALALGIETSCDETAAAVVAGGRRILSNVIHSQIDVHARYGGVVPELASRNHVVAVLPVLDRALAEAGVELQALDRIAVTVGPGLVGSLMVGLETAKSLAYVAGCPLVPVNHLEGHLLSPFVDAATSGLSFPYVALIVSGGHTLLVWARGPGDYRRLGRTLDDAAGEAFDKVAKRLGGDYPGGPFVERCARAGDAERYPLPSPMLGRGLDFSFSGLKTAAAQRIAELEALAPKGEWLSDICASVQAAAVRVLVRKAIKAVRKVGASRLVIAGGVASNTALRESAEAATAAAGVDLFVPARVLCTDNAAMIACVGSLGGRIGAGAAFEQAAIDVRASWPIASAPAAQRAPIS